jgi:hypothetical protein
MKLTEVNGDLESMRSTTDELTGIKTKLEAANKELSEKESSLTALIAQNQFGGMQQQTQGRPNIYGLLGGGAPAAGTGAPRGTPPQRAVGLASTAGGSGDTRRGNLTGTATTTK